MAFAMVLLAAPAARGQPAFLRGNSNGDARVDISDGIYTLGYLFLGGPEPRCFDGADANDSGGVDLSDAIYTLSYLFYGGPRPPAPGPSSPGFDPTDDDLGCGPPGPSVGSLLEPPVDPPAAPLARRKGWNGKVKGNDMRLAGPGDGRDDDCDGFSVLGHSGELQLEETDLSVPGRGLDFRWVRTYRSRTGRSTPMGEGWDHSYNIHARDDGDSITVCDGRGRCDEMTRSPDGTYSRRELFCEGRVVDGAFVLTFADTGTWTFHPFDRSVRSGKIVRIEDRNGNFLSIDYDAEGRCDRIVDTLGREYRVAYTEDGRVRSVTDFTGRAVAYAYHGSGGGAGGLGDLASVTRPPVTGTPNGNDFPDGKTTTYAYTVGQPDSRLLHNLVRVTDPKGQTWLQVEYHATLDPTSRDFDAVASTLRGIEKKDIRRIPVEPSSSNGFAAVVCIERDGLGNVREQYYDSRNRCVFLRELTGRADPALPTTLSENRPTGKLRASDPDVFETRWEWNDDSLCTLEVLPRGDSVRFVHEGDLDPAASPRKRADLRVVRRIACCDMDDDGDGTVDELVSLFEHDPRFGSPGATRYDPRNDWRGRRKGWDGTVKWSTMRRKGWDGTVKGSTFDGDNTPIIRGSALGRKGWDGTVKGSTKAFDGEGLEFVVRATDPRGTTTTAVHDDGGNLVHVETPDAASGAVVAWDLEHDAHGQLTAIVHPADATGRRRRDEVAYHDAGPQAGYPSRFVADAAEGGVRATTSFEYDALGRLTRCVDPRGFETIRTWNALDQVVEAHSPPSTTYPYVRWGVELSYDANDNLVRVDTENRDEAGALDPENPHWSSLYEYDDLDRLRLAAHEAAHVAQQSGGVHLRTRYTYDAAGNLVLEELPAAMDGVDPNAVVSHDHDERGLLLRSTRAPGTEIASSDEYDYDALGNLVVHRRGIGAPLSSIAEEPAVTTFAWDGLGRPRSVRDAMGNVTTFRHDPNGNVIGERVDGELIDVPGSSENRRLSATRYEYDALDRCVAVRLALFDPTSGEDLGDGESTATFAYAPNGLITSETDDNGNATTYSHDSLHRLHVVTDPRGNTVTCAWDPSGNLESVTERALSDVGGPAQVFTLRYEYDSLDRCIRRTDDLGNVETCAWDSRDNLVRRSDARGNDTVYVHDGLGRVSDIRSHDGSSARGITINTTHVEYETDRARSSTDGNGNTTTYEHDALGRLVRTTHPDGTTERLIWSPRSNVISREDAEGTLVTQVHDLLDRCVRRDLAPATGVSSATTFEAYRYDGASRLVGAENDGSTSTWSWPSVRAKQDVYVWKVKTRSSFGPLQATQSGAPGPVTCTYDGEGNRLSVTYASGRVVKWSHDALGRVVSVGTISPGGTDLVPLATYAYEGADRLARIARSSGVDTRIDWGGFPGSGQGAADFGWKQVARVDHARSGADPVDQRVFEHDRSQNRTLRVQTAPFLPGRETVTNTFAYDALDRLVRSSRVRASTSDYFRTYVLDPNGNRQQAIENGVVHAYTMDPTLPEPADFQMDQYTVTPFGSEHHDRNGNLRLLDAPTGPTHFLYDGHDRLVEVQRFGGGVLVPVVSYAYDALGRLVSKTEYPPAPLAPVMTLHVLDPDQDCDGILEEVRGGGIVSAAVSSVSALAGSAGGGAASAAYAATGRAAPPPLVVYGNSGEATFLHADDLGNVLALTDEKGNVVERCDYDDYGVPRFLDVEGNPLVGGDGLPVAASPRGNPYLFHGMFLDGETGLYRWKEFSPAEEQLKGNPRHIAAPYDPRTGRVRKALGRMKCSDVTLERASSTFGGGNPWSAKVVEKATSGLKDTLKTQVRMASAGAAGAVGIPGGAIISARAKQDVYVWKVKTKKEEGGRHTPFHNKYVAKVSDFGMSRLHAEGIVHRDIAARSLAGDDLSIDIRETTTGLDVEYRLYGPGTPHWGSATVAHAPGAWFLECSKGKDIRKNITVNLRLIVPIAMDKGLR